MKILIIDDFPDGAESLAELLACHDHEVRFALTPIEAGRICKSFRADAVVTEVLLRGMDGYRLADVLRMMLPADVCWIGMSGLGHLEGRSLSEGFNHHFTKPVNAPALLAALTLSQRLAPAASASGRPTVIYGCD